MNDFKAGQTDTAEFVLRAVEAGQTAFDAYTRFEVLLNTPPHGRSETPRYLYARGARSVAIEAASGGPVHAYVAAQGAGLRIVDVSDSAIPVQVRTMFAPHQ